jgi:hypothetical protein
MAAVCPTRLRRQVEVPIGAGRMSESRKVEGLKVGEKGVSRGAMGFFDFMTLRHSDFETLKGVVGMLL